MAPFSGYDPLDHGQGAEGFDPTGNSIDPSYYYALSPGGRFPGDIWSYLEGQAGQDRAAGRTSGEANPDYNVPDWLERIPGQWGSIIARLVRGHESNVRNNADAAGSDPLRGGDVYAGWSGPGAPYGPMGGPLHGLLDQGSDHLGDFDVGDRRVDTPPGPPGRERRGGGGSSSFGPLNFQPYQGMSGNASFVDWQPTQPFAAGGDPTRMVTRQLGAPPQAPAPPARPGQPRPPAGGRAGRGGGGGRGGRGGVATKPGGSGPMNDLNAEILRLLFPEGSRAGSGRPGSPAPPQIGPPRPRPGVSPGQMDYGRGGGERGYDTNYLERGSPGWTRDPTTGILNTSGMPRATPPSRGLFATDDDYITALHDLGWDSESIIGLMNGWGTGSVVRGDEGYMFANDPRAQESSLWPAYRPDDLWIGGRYPDRDRLPSGGGGEYVATGGAGGGLGRNPENAVSMLTSGWTPTARYF